MSAFNAGDNYRCEDCGGRRFECDYTKFHKIKITMLKDIIEKPIAEIMKTLRIVGKFKTPEEVDAYFEKSLNETAQIVAREVSESLVKVVDDYEQDIKKLHHRMMGTAHDDCKEMLAFDMHSRLIAIKHIKEKLNKKFTHLQSLEEELENSDEIIPDIPGFEGTREDLAKISIK